MNQNRMLLNGSVNGLQQIIFAICRCISHGIRIIITTIANNTTTLNIGRRPHKASIQDDIHYDEFRKVCPLLLLQKEDVKAVQSLQRILVARKGPSIREIGVICRRAESSFPRSFFAFLKRRLNSNQSMPSGPHMGRHFMMMPMTDVWEGRQSLAFLLLQHPWTTTSNSSTNPVYTRTVPEVQHTRSAYNAALLPRQSIIVIVANHG
jgi:hypothetical protein